MRIHSDVLPDTIVRHTGLPRPFITQTIRHMKAAGRISAGRPYAPPLTARDITRLLIALSAKAPGTAVEHERTVGRLLLAVGVGESTAEAAITSLIAAPHASGQIAIAPTFVEIRQPAGMATYGVVPDGCATIFVIPIPTACAIAGALLNKENQ